MAVLTREQIRSAKDRKTKTIAVPEWGGDVLLISFTAADRERIKEDEFRDKLIASGHFRAWLLSRCLVGEDLRPLFAEKDVAELAAKSEEVIDRLTEQAVEFCGIRKAAVEEAEKNSEATPSGSSSSS
jgi:hypothetical protein